MNPLRVALIGAKGRMGTAVLSAAEMPADLEIAERCERGKELSLDQCDVIIDFSHADATSEVCAAAVQAKKPLVIGTTGHTTAQLDAIKRASEKIPVILASNFSIGVNTLFWLTRKAAELLGPGFDLEIVETHHRLKKDAPSGTAQRLAEILCEARNLSYATNIAHGREGMIGERPDAQIGMHSIRAGDVVGEHTVIFAGKGERLELTHKAASRETFAVGALRAARWLVGKPPGLYDMEDVLGL